MAKIHSQCSRSSFGKKSYTYHTRIYHRYKLGDQLRAGVLGLGIILLILGLFFILIFWPLIGFETQNTFDSEDIKADGSLKYVGEITDIEDFAGIYVLELDQGTLEAFTENKNFEVNDQVVVTIKYGGNTTNWDENTYTVEKVPTMGGIYGALFFFVGFVMCLAGLVTKKTDITEAVEFSLKPSTQMPAYGNGQSESATRPGPLQPGLGDEVTCPKCSRIFPVPSTKRPMMIKCPECGVEGVLK